MQYRLWVQGKTAGYFVRFGRHFPAIQVHIDLDYRKSYAFATRADAERVAEQVRSGGIRAEVHVERPAAAPPPPPPRVSVSNSPPPNLNSWVDRLIRAGLASAGKGCGTGECIKAGYRSLARECHPDHGGKTSDMQKVGAARDWLHAHPTIAASRMAQIRVSAEDFDLRDDFGSGFDDGPPLNEPLTDDDIPF